MPDKKQIKIPEESNLAHLDKNQISELRFKHEEKMMELRFKAQEAQIDLVALNNALDMFNTQTDKASQSGNSATFQHSQETSIGKTQVIIGNTEQAATGRMTGESNTIKIVLIIAVAIIFVAIFMSK